MRIMILNDGETYTNAEGCLLVDLGEDVDWTTDDLGESTVEDIASGLDNNDRTEAMTVNGVPFTATVIARF